MLHTGNRHLSSAAKNNSAGDAAELHRLRRQVAWLQRELDAVRTGAGESSANTDADRHDDSRFKAFAEISSDWFWEMGPDLRFTYISERYFEITGTKPEQRIGLTRMNWVNEAQRAEDAAKWEEHLAILEARQPFRNFEYSDMQPDGRVRHYRISGAPVFGEHGAFQGYRGTGTDITATVAAHHENARAQQFLMRAVENLSEAFALFDSDDRLVFCNRMFREINAGVGEKLQPGLRFEDLIRTNVESGQVLDAIGREEAYLSERMAEHRNPGTVLYSERADGRWIMMRDERAMDGGIIVTNTDLTEIRKREIALRQAKEHAERANRAKSDFLTMMSHELRTPLNAIIGFSDVLAQELFGPLGGPQYSSYANDILDSGKHLLDLINDILDLSKIEAGKYDLKLGAVDIGALVRRCGSSVRAQARTNGIALRVRIEPDLPMLHADGRAVRQILLNLLSNAVKFTPQGGKVRLRAVRTRAGGIRLGVYDTGIGIAASDIETIFMPFGQLANIEHTNSGGTGLGLPIANSLVAMHGGTLSVKSEPGAWTRMTVDFPADRVLD